MAGMGAEQDPSCPVLLAGRGRRLPLAPAAPLVGGARPHIILQCKLNSFITVAQPGLANTLQRNTTQHPPSPLVSVKISQCLQGDSEKS